MIDFTKVPNIHYWTQRVLPCVFDESLSYVEKINKLEEEINKLIEKTWLKTSIMTVNTKNDIEQSCIGLSAMVTFIGLYLGIIFLISSAAILALKELSESTDNRERYVMLRKLGADEKMLNKALFKQIGLFFGFPLFIAIIHSIVGIKFCNIILLSHEGNPKRFIINFLSYQRIRVLVKNKKELG